MTLLSEASMSVNSATAPNSTPLATWSFCCWRSAAHRVMQAEWPARAPHYQGDKVDRNVAMYADLKPRYSHIPLSLVSFFGLLISTTAQSTLV